MCVHTVIRGFGFGQGLATDTYTKYIYAVRHNQCLQIQLSGIVSRACFYVDGRGYTTVHTYKLLIYTYIHTYSMLILTITVMSVRS